MIAKKLTIEAVTVCVDYSDFLAETLPTVLPQVDRLVVVTTPGDTATRAMCKRFGVGCAVTDAFYRDDPEVINKARGINFGLAHLACRDWILHIDADIALPPMTRKMLENADLDPRCIYGIDRVNCHGAREWDAHRASPAIQYEWGCLVHPPAMPLGSRVIHGDYGGYAPIGFFQLWHGSEQERYPILTHSDMERSDVLHSLRWPRSRRVLLPEIIAVHLDSEDAGRPMGKNWSGRKSRPFRPGKDVAPKAGPGGY